MKTKKEDSSNYYIDNNDIYNIYSVHEYADNKKPGEWEHNSKVQYIQ